MLDSTDTDTFYTAIRGLVGRDHGGEFPTAYGYLLRFTTAYGVFDGYIVEPNVMVSVEDGAAADAGFIVHCTDTEGETLPEGHPDRFAFVLYTDLKAIGIY